MFYLFCCSPFFTGFTCSVLVQYMKNVNEYLHSDPNTPVAVRKSANSAADLKASPMPPALSYLASGGQVNY